MTKLTLRPGCKCSSVPPSNVLPMPTTKALIKVLPTTQDVSPQTKHPQGESSQMDVRSMAVVVVKSEETTKAKLKELERLAEFGLHDM